MPFDKANDTSQTDSTPTNAGSSGNNAESDNSPDDSAMQRLDRVERQLNDRAAQITELESSVSELRSELDGLRQVFDILVTETSEIIDAECDVCGGDLAIRRPLLKEMSVECSNCGDSKTPADHNSTQRSGLVKGDPE